MRLLITGGAGFIGSHIQDLLLSSGHEVAILDNLSSGKLERIDPKSTLFKADIRSKQEVFDILNKYKPEGIFHLAAQIEVPHSMAFPQEDLEINIGGTLNVLLAAKDTDVKKIVYTNTGGAYYGDVDESLLPLTEDTPVKYPTSAYGVSKTAAENYVKLFGHAFNLPFVSLRYANVYGPRQDGNREAGIVAIFTAKMLKGEIPTINGDGLHSRDYVYVGDVAKANLLALSYPHNDYFNIATSTRITNRQVYDTLAQILNISTPPNYGPARPGDARHVSLSITKAQSLLNWSPSVDFTTGVSQTVAWYRSQTSNSK